MLKFILSVLILVIFKIHKIVKISKFMKKNPSTNFKNISLYKTVIFHGRLLQIC